MAPAVRFELTTKRLTAAEFPSQKSPIDRHTDRHGPSILGPAPRAACRQLVWFDGIRWCDRNGRRHGCGT